MGSTRNGCRISKCPSASRIRMVREDKGTPSEEATSAWMATDEAVGCTHAFLTMWGSSRRLVCRGRSEPDLHANDLGSTGTNTSSQHNHSGLTDELLA
ncbi:uncharacterized protein TNCV_4464831 [Trichonephila clavipes]|nr:uncharacterized protein TNCV_4464831 [Trichonephila clavipes]